MRKATSDKEVSLQDVINRCQLIIDGLENNGAWLAVLEDFNEQRQRLDDTWQNVSDDKAWYEYRITKLAVMKVLNLVEDYKSDMKVALEEKFKLDNPDKIIQRDYQEA